MAPRRKAAAGVPAPPDAALLQRHALRIAIAEGRAFEADGAAVTERRLAEQVFREARRLGTQTLRVVLPDGAEIATIPIRAGARELRVDEDALFAIAAANDPGDIETFVYQHALADPRVIALVRELFPELTGQRIEASARAAYMTEFEEHDGSVADRAAGERVSVGEVVRHDATGEFQYRPKDRQKAWAAVQEALSAGTLTEDGEVVTAVAGAGDDPNTSAVRVDRDVSRR